MQTKLYYVTCKDHAEIFTISTISRCDKVQFRITGITDYRKIAYFFLFLFSADNALFTF